MTIPPAKDNSALLTQLMAQVINEAETVMVRVAQTDYHVETSKEQALALNTLVQGLLRVKEEGGILYLEGA